MPEGERKRCENCNKLFGARRMPNGALEYPSYFKKRRFCSRICGAIGTAAQRKLTCDEVRA